MIGKGSKQAGWPPSVTQRSVEKRKFKGHADEDLRASRK
jgi:hypothetical protein